MEIDLHTGRLYVFLGGFLIFLIIETLFAKRASDDIRGRRFAFHIGVATLNTIIVRLFLYVPFLLWVVYVEEEGWGISRWLGLVGWTEIIVSIIVLDLFDYFWHRFNHQIRFLWRFHKAHHSDTQMDVSTALRFHPGELVISSFVKGMWVVVWGPTVVAWFLFETLVSLSAQFHHSNIDFPNKIERCLSVIIVTPRYHAAHHAVDRNYGNANFSTIFSVWDKLFLTYSKPALNGLTTSEKGSIGLPEKRQFAFSLAAWITEPFTTRNLNLNNKKII